VQKVKLLEICPQQCVKANEDYIAYFLTFINDFSRKTHVYTFKAKGEAFEKFKQYKVLVENEAGHKIKVLQSDNGGEFVSKKFDAFFAECGI